MKRDPRAHGGGGSDRKLFLAVVLGVSLGLMAALWHIRGLENSSFGDSSGSAGSEEAAERIQKRRELLQRKVQTLKAQLEEAERQKEETTTKVETLLKEKKRKEDAAKAAASGQEDEQTAALRRTGPPGTVHGPRHSPLFEPLDRSSNPALADVLERVAINKEVIVGISNINIRDMLITWFTQIKHAGIKNYIVVALDEATQRLCEENDVPWYRQEARIAATQQGTGDNHAISSSKFHLIREFLTLGYSVFLSDIDIVFLQNPFEGDRLKRDVDVEGMTDGFSNNTAYGWDDTWDDPAMGWSRYAHTMRIFVFNSGLFYIRPTKAVIELLDRVAGRLAREKAWDQAVYNEEMFFPSHPSTNGLHISKRALDFYDFLNSKTLFKEVRKQARFDNFVPVTVHVNYHPDKYPRMLAIIDKYVHGQTDALDRFPDGSE